MKTCEHKCQDRRGYDRDVLVVFDDDLGKCPFCEAQERIEQLDSEVEGLQKQVEDLQE